ncbi:unnamed protein product, partial [marine sediment metagenome]
ECSSGPCCDIASCSYKSNGAQPTDNTDFYYCSGTNSATGTNYVKQKDYFCNGNDADAHEKDTDIDTCGACEYCTDEQSSCSDYSSSTTCGTQECDGLDTTCRNYDDVDKYCSGTGTYSDSTCSSYTNIAAGTLCGSSMECDGSGNCGNCDSHDYYSCYDNDVYWYDSCDNIEGNKEECGTDTCSTTWNYYCDGNDIRRWRYCYDTGCSGNECYGGHIEDRWKDDEYVENCPDGCETGGALGAYCHETCANDAACGSEYKV